MLEIKQQNSYLNNGNFNILRKWQEGKNCEYLKTRTRFLIAHNLTRVVHKTQKTTSHLRSSHIGKKSIICSREQKIKNKQADDTNKSQEFYLAFKDMNYESVKKIFLLYQTGRR